MKWEGKAHFIFGDKDVYIGNLSGKSGGLGAGDWMQKEGYRLTIALFSGK